MKMALLCCDMVGLAAEIPVGCVVITHFKEHCDCRRLTVVPQMKRERGRERGRRRVGEDTRWDEGNGGGSALMKKREHDCFQIEMDDNRSRKGWRAERVGGEGGKDK